MGARQSLNAALHQRRKEHEHVNSTVCPLRLLTPTPNSTVCPLRPLRSLRPTTTIYVKRSLFVLIVLVVLASVFVLYKLLSISLDAADGQRIIQSEVEKLRVLYVEWKDNGSRSDFKLDDFIQSNSAEYFLFTNRIVVDGKVFHSRFACRSKILFPETICITDEGTALYLCDKSDKVIISPEKYWLWKSWMSGVDRTGGEKVKLKRSVRP
jgi:hypothetical protein